MFCAPEGRLRSHIIGSYQGWAERTSLVMRRREIPKIMVPMILNFGPRFGVDSSGRGDGAGMQDYGSFAAGLHDRYAVVESSGRSQCIQFNLTPLSARRILGCSMNDLENRVTDLGDILGARFSDLMARLQDARDWAGRFALLDSFLADRLADAPGVRPEVAWAMAKLHRSGGAAGIGDLAAQIGCSRKRLIALFRDQVGQTPKTVARILRFNRIVGLLGSGSAMGWAELAYDCGYYDQAHFNRDFREFTGCTPGEYLLRQMPAGGGTRDG
ncbi:MAG TPA: helix-turn-helix domain-containing protein [Dongiaceae bacterium]